MSVPGTPRDDATQHVVRTGPAELAGSWEFDPAHSRLGFLAPQLVITTVRGVFGDVVGSASLDPANPHRSEVLVTIRANSIDTGNRRRDAHLSSAAYLEVDAYPIIAFRSTQLRPTPDPAVWTVVGDLTIKGVTWPVELTMTYLGASGDPSNGGIRAEFEGSARINRTKWGVMWNRVIEAGGVVIGNHITLELEIQAIKKS
ncbi:MAG TPA: YceI family protein [Actinomycetes bacterium]|nr:YceI family protein [Actinomycetes bacterium]